MTDVIAKLPPQNIEAEQAVLGAILLDNDALYRAHELVRAEDFYRSGHRDIFAAMLRLGAAEQPIDLLTMSDELTLTGTLDKCGGISYVSGLVNVVANAANIAAHCRIIRDKAVRRKVIAGIAGLTDAAYGTETPTPELIERASAAVFALERPERKLPDLDSMISEAWVRQKLIDTGSLTYIPTSRIINGMIPGYYPGDDWIITAPSTIGKSTLLSQLVVDACRAGAKVAMFTLEDSREEKLNRIRANVADVSYRLIRQGELDEFKRGLLRKADAEILGHKGAGPWPLWIYDDVRTLEDLVLTVRKHAMQTGIDIICIDYVQLLRIPGKIYEKMSLAADTLFNLAKDVGCTMIKCSQVSNAHAKDPGDDLAAKGAGELTAQPDVTIELARKHLDPDKWHLLELTVKKSRQFGDKGLINLAFSPRWTRIVPRDELNEGEY